MAGGLPETFWVKEKRRGAATFVATRSQQDKDRYVLTTPGVMGSKARKGIITILPSGTRKRDGSGYRQGVMLGKNRVVAEAFWKPMRRIDDATAETVSTARGTDSTGSPTVRLSFRMNTRQVRDIIVTQATSRQLYVQLHEMYGPKHHLATHPKDEET